MTIAVDLGRKATKQTNKINNLPYSDRYGSFRCLKEESQWTCYLFSLYFKSGFLNFSNICCWYTLELPHRGNYRGNSNVHLQHVSIQKMSVFHYKTGFSQTSQPLFMFQCNEHVEMNTFCVVWHAPG